MRVKAVHLALQRHLPPGVLREEAPVIDAKYLGTLLQRVALDHPDDYNRVVKKLGDIGRMAAYTQGESMGVEDLRDPIDTKGILSVMDKEIAAIKADDPAERRQKTEDIWLRYASRLEREAMQAAKLKGNAVADSVVSGARGKPLQLRAMLSTPALFEDSAGRIIPIFARSSYSAGVSPAEMLAGTYGARTSVTATKTSTAKGGFWSKMLAQAAADVVVTEDDCGTTNGIDLTPDDPSLRHRVLARAGAGGALKGGELITRKTLATIQNKHKGPVLVRSAITCESKRGVCAKCAGAGPDGRLPHIGDNVGVTAAQSLGEPVTQSALNTKHCLLKGTLVRMADYSVRPIELINVGEQVLGSDRYGNTFPVTVTNVWDQGMQEVQQYSFRRGQTMAYSSVVCTAEHAILSHVRGTAQPAKLPAGYASSKLAAVLPKDTCTAGTSSTLALLCGLLLGDGIRWNPDASGAPRMSCADPRLVEDLNKLISDHQLKAVKAARSHDYRIVFTAYSKQGQKRDKETGRLVKDSSKQHPLKKVMRTWGMDGKYAHEKTLPPDVLSWDATSVAALIAGYLATDGSIGINGQGNAFISFGSTSLTLLQQIKQLLELRLCVYAGSITRTRHAGQGSSKHDLFALCVTRQDQISRLLHKLPPVPGVKGAKVLEVLRLCDSRKARNPEAFFRANRKSVEAKGIGHCFDISVAHEDELFVLANGLIVSNTSGAAQGRRTYAGLDWLARFVQVPDNFPDRAPLSEAEGVARLERAPQGGTYVKIGEHTHYVPQHLPVLVKDGEQVEAGTQLSDGIVRPDDVVRIKGLGEGRLYYARRLKQMLDDGGTPANPRQAEIVARGAVNHVRLNQADNFTGYLPDDPVRYNDLLDQWEEDKEAVDSRPEAASGMYLQRPALHFTVGTRLTPSMTKKLKSVGVESIRVSSNPPPFSSEMMRLQTQAYANPDWLASQQTSYLGRQLSDAARRGQDTNVKHNVHFAPALAYGVEFGKRLEETGTY